LSIAVPNDGASRYLTLPELSAQSRSGIGVDGMLVDEGNRDTI
jgi:hypothetical protein